jgi:hypothetical protein
LNALNVFNEGTVMKRQAMAKLISWKNKTDKMPLIIEGARQRCRNSEKTIMKMPLGFTFVALKYQNA